MLSERAKTILERHVAMKGRKMVLRELGISPATLSQVLSDKYGASTEAIEKKILRIYGDEGLVDCPKLGQISPGKCADNHHLAQRISTAGNPETIRLYIACRKCTFRR